MARFGRKRGESAASMFSSYNNGVVSHTQMQQRERRAESIKSDPNCCCCKATHVLLLCNLITLLIGVALLATGAIINNHISGWNVSGRNIMGHLCLGLGGFILFVSVLGIAAARTRLRLLEFVYLFFLILMSAFLILVLAHVALEADNLEGFLRANWDKVEDVLGTDVTMDEAKDAFNDYFLVIFLVGGSGAVVLLLTLICAMRLLGLRFIALAQLVALGAVGAGTVAIAVLSRAHLPAVTTWLLFGCGAVQVLCSACGLAGFWKKNRECIMWLFGILLVSTGGLVYVAAASHRVLRRDVEEEGDLPEDLLLVFAIATMAVIFNASTLVFEGVYYCRQRRQFREADRAAQLPVHFSSNHRRFANQGKKRGRRGVYEYNPRSAL